MDLEEDIDWKLTVEDTIWDKNSLDNIHESSTWCRKFQKEILSEEYFVQYFNTKVRQEKLTKILMSDKFLSGKVCILIEDLHTKLSIFTWY